MQQHVTNSVKAQRHKYVSAAVTVSLQCPPTRITELLEKLPTVRGEPMFFCNEFNYSAMNMGSNFGQGVQLQCAISL